MKHSFLIFLFFVSVIGSASSCDKKNRTSNTTIENSDDNMQSTQISIRIGSKTFTATLLDNNSAKAFKEMLPMTITMTELNGDEKYYDLPKNLPTNSSNPNTIQNGDLMLYGSRTVVLFYKSFQTSYSYTNLGKIDDPSGLSVALGLGNVTVTFEKELPLIQYSL